MSTPPPYSNISGTNTVVSKYNQQETIAEVNGNAKPGQLIVDLEVDPPLLYIGNNAGNISLVGGGGGSSDRLINGTEEVVLNSNGSLTFPTLTVDLHNGGNQNGQVLQFGNAGQQAIITGPTPAVNINAERLIIQGQRGNGTGEGGDVYFWAGDADTNGGDIKIYAGDADNVSTGSGGYINLDGGSGFDGGGQISLTGGYSQGGIGGPVYISAGQGANGGVVNINGGGASANGGGYVNIQGGFGQSDGGVVTIAGGGSALGLANYGNVQITAGVSTWTFSNDGNLVLANGNSVIQSIANSSLDPLIPNVSTMILTPDANYNSQVLVLDPTAPGHIHLRAPSGTGNIDEPAANIFLGGEISSFEVGYYTGSAPNVFIHSNNNTWTFGIDGNLTAPGNIIASGSGGDITLTGGNITGALRIITSPTALTSLTAVAGGRAFINDSNLSASGNFGALVGNGGSNTVPVWSDGTNWYIG